MYHLVMENVHKYAATVSRRDQLLGDGFCLVEDDSSKTHVTPDGEEKKPEPMRRRK